MTLQEKLSAFLVRPPAVDSELLVLCKRAIADCMGAIIKGSHTSLSKSMLNLCQNGSVSVAGHRKTLSARDAAMVGGIAGHVLELDDTCSSNMGHPTVAVLPAILAVAEEENSTGLDVLMAFLLATEIECKIGRLCARTIHKKGWHATSVLGVFGAAAGAGLIMGLNEGQLSAALGIAASFASGVRDNFSSPVKALHIGKVNADGVYAAMLARAGISSALTAIDGNEGFLRLYAGDGFILPDDEFYASLGNPFDIAKPGFTIKKHPSCSSTHRAIDGFADLYQKNNFAAEDIVALKFGLSASAIQELVTPIPKNGDEAKFSIGFQAALMLHGEKNIPENYTEQCIFRPEIQNIINRTSIFHETSFDNLPSDMGVGPASITVILKDGTQLEHERQWPAGHLLDPMPLDDLREKYLGCAGDVLGMEKAVASFDSIMELETLESIKHLTSLLN